MTPPPSPMVWVKHGKTQYLAEILEERERMAMIRWEANRQVEWVPIQDVEKNLPPKRTRRSPARWTPPCKPDVVKSESFIEVKACAHKEEGLLANVPLAPMKRKRQKVDKDDDSRLCTRQLLIEHSMITEEIVDGDDASLDTQEDVLLSDLAASRNDKSEENDSWQFNHLNQTKRLRSGRAKDGRIIAKDEAVTSHSLLAETILPQSTRNHNSEVLNTCLGFSRIGVSTPLIASNLMDQVHDHPDHQACANMNDESQTSFTQDVLPNDTSPGQYTHKSSAYVQNLAEICSTILHDRRWRMGRGMKALFAWEYGDDMKAIVSLSQMYEPMPKAPSGVRSCPCVLGCDGIDRDDHGLIEEVNETRVETTPNDSNGRALNLYCRLFYRKGPWFRVDDIYAKYYSPKSKSKHGVVIDTKGPNSRNYVNTDQFDEKKFQNAISKMQDMMVDLNSLCRQGLVRTFKDEEECGRIAGSVKSDGSGFLLSMEERRSVLRKLGGARKHADAKGESTGTNAIWQQMCQQQSIVGMMSFSEQVKSRRVLPVRPHVNHEVLNKLAALVVKAATGLDTQNDPFVRTKVLQVKQSLVSGVAQSDVQAWNLSKVDSCYRLQEEPLLALRRCCRLFLCATSGPGDMRGDSTNGWKSIRDSFNRESTHARLPESIPPPGDGTWHTTAYPGLLSRFGLAHYGFLDAYEELPVSEVSNGIDITMEQVFTNLHSFQLWELSVEIRANVDFLVELNALQLYDERRKIREAEGEKGNPHRNIAAVSQPLRVADRVAHSSKIDIDYLDILQENTRKALICQFCMDFAEHDQSCESIAQMVEESISSIFTGDVAERVKDEHLMLTDCERIIFVLTIVLTNIFCFCYRQMSTDYKMTKSRRCWLRHMWWEGVLAYVLWDCIPLLEKRGLHQFAARALEVLVFGSLQPDLWNDEVKPEASWGFTLERVPFGDLMISRRARGKAIERLMIDYIHILRKDLKINKATHTDGKRCRVDSMKKKKADARLKLAAVKINVLCKQVLAFATASAFISFSAIRTLARRLKKPLNQVLEVGGGQEAQELGLRMRNTDDAPDQRRNAYVDWMPPTDQAVAVALVGSRTTAGSRCSYVGLEGENDGMAHVTSLNVEQLALEYYGTGRLPRDNEVLAGGNWEGWHDEGGRLRTLFRIMCGCPLLGMDGGCGKVTSRDSRGEHYTVHLTRYQRAPFDLHVGSWKNHTHGLTSQSVSGFYSRRSDAIERLLSKLEKSTPQELSDYVYNSIRARALVALTTRSRNITLVSDIQQIRTLSMLAAGFGGKQLAAAFRCMLFDYRHFSGGLPDLLLTRALYADTKGVKEFVDLGEWVGESFTQEARAEKMLNDRSKMLRDLDDEFLGCSKVGDSGTSRSGRPSIREQRQGAMRPPPQIPELPPKLELLHSRRPIGVQCLFVEVKSQNDRLDGRQEDWLNVLDRVGHARVCKFVNNKMPIKKNGSTKQDANAKYEEL